jgi:hypothetical protein
MPDEQETEQLAPQFQLTDLLLAVQVIQLAAQRGAIKAEEMTQVGGLFERILAFLKDSGALTSTEEQEQDQSQGE